jgi:hypothetical protein
MTALPVRGPTIVGHTNSLLSVGPSFGSVSHDAVRVGPLFLIANVPAERHAAMSFRRVRGLAILVQSARRVWTMSATSTTGFGPKAVRGAGRRKRRKKQDRRPPSRQPDAGAMAFDDWVNTDNRKADVIDAVRIGAAPQSQPSRERARPC